MSVETDSSSRKWAILIFLTVLCVYFYVLMEWLFFITKPSFMSNLTLIDSLRVLFAAPAPLLAASVAAPLLLWILSAAVRISDFRRTCLAVGLFVPASILAAASFLLVDNFTYTIFHFGVKTAVGIQRYVYIPLLLMLIVFCYQFLHDLSKRLLQSALNRTFAYIAPCLLLSIIAVSITYGTSKTSAEEFNVDIDRPERMPNIILIASDGLNAQNMSAYGYHRDTTPFISELAKNALLCENCFTNAGTSGGSISSMFTGRLPTQTRLIYPPDILKGSDVYQHLPGILKKFGYSNIDISIRHYADPYDLNMKNSFDWANSREINVQQRPDLLSSMLGHDVPYFLRQMRDRLRNRLFHVYGLQEMEDTYAEVTDPNTKTVMKSKKFIKGEPISRMFDFIDASPPPFFAHLHLLGTHGPKFHRLKRQFSKGKTQIKPWMTDFYDDAILKFDDQVEKIILELVNREIMTNTVIVICTDHGQRFRVYKRLPLLFMFPNGENAGRITANAQNLDIAPTILDYMGVEKPGWMRGQSLLSAEIDPDRYIFTADRKHGDMEKRTRAGWELDGSIAGAPFYSLGSVGVFFHQKFYRLDLEENVLTVSDIEGHTAPCCEEDAPDPESVGRLIAKHLEECGYDVSSIKTPPSIQLK